MKHRLKSLKPTRQKLCAVASMMFLPPLPLVALCEEASVGAIASGLEPDQTTVGIEIDIEHLAPTPIGMKVRTQSTLIAIDGRILTFSCEAFDEREQVARATHKRCLVDEVKFQQKANAKLDA